MPVSTHPQQLPAPPTHPLPPLPHPQTSFQVFGMELLCQLDTRATADFFTTFFRLPASFWRGFLASKLSSGEGVGRWRVGGRGGGSMADGGCVTGHCGRPAKCRRSYTAAALLLK